MSTLPPFPVDDTSLDLLMAAIDPQAAGDTEAKGSCVGAFLEWMSEMGGSDTRAVAEVLDPATNPLGLGELGAASIVMMRDQRYTTMCVTEALITEIWRLRSTVDPARVAPPRSTERGYVDDTGKNHLPPFPVDDITLNLLWSHLYPGVPSDRGGITPCLDFLSEMGGSDPHAVSEVIDEGSDADGLAGASIVMMRDQYYHDNNMIEALVAEVRRLRAVTP